MNKILRIWSVLCCLLIFGCGLNDDPAKDQGIFNLSDLEGSCKFDSEKVKKILEEDVSKEIDCLESNLKQFADFVEREDPRYISKEELKKFIKKFFNKDYNEIKETLDFAFKLNTFIFKDKHDNLSVANIRRVFTLVHAVNAHGRFIRKYIDLLQKDGKEYWYLRSDLISRLNSLALAAKEAISTVTPVAEPNDLDIVEVMEDLNDIIEDPEDHIDIAEVRPYLFGKTLSLGGSKEKLSHTELVDFLGKGSDLLSLVLDFVYTEDRIFADENHKNLQYLELLYQVHGFFHKSLKKEDPIVSHLDLIEIGQRFVDENTDEDDYENRIILRRIEDSIINIKEKIIGSTGSEFSYADILYILSLGQDLLERFHFAEITFDYHKDIMQNPNPIAAIEIPNLSSYKIFPEKRLNQLWQEFKLIVTNYQFYHDESDLQTYENPIHRSKFGLKRTLFIRFALNLLLEYYGHKSSYPHSLVVNSDEIKEAAIDLRSLLIELDVWRDKIEMFIFDVMSSGDMFQFQSDGTQELNLEEGSEYLNVIFSSTTIVKQMMNGFEKYCQPIIVPGKKKDERTYDFSCFEKHYFKVFLEDLGYKVNYPKLFAYVSKADSKDIKQYLRNISSYARIQKEGTPIGIKDLSRIVVSMSNLEATVIRYDENNSNTLDNNELHQAYKRFKEILLDFAGVPDSGRLGKSVYFYLLKKMAIPNVVQLLFFHWFEDQNKIKATRLHVSAVLAIIAEEVRK